MPLHIQTDLASIRSVLQVIFAQSRSPVAFATWSYGVQLERPTVAHTEAWRLACQEASMKDLLPSPLILPDYTRKVPS